MDNSLKKSILSRRGFLQWGSNSLLSLGLPFSILSSSNLENMLIGDNDNVKIIPPKLVETIKAERSLNFYNTHTGEFLKRCVFWSDGQFNQQALKSINRLFRDHRSNKAYTIDTRLLSLLHNISQKLGSTKPFHLVSGYRSPETNEKLRVANYGVAKHSQHTLGKAADIYVEGHSLKHIQQAALSLKVGGVGRYERFVHIDTGKVRRWGRMV